MNSVVQRILDSAEKQKNMAQTLEDGRIINLTVEENPKEKGTTSTITLDLSQVSVETDVLKSILANVNKTKQKYCQEYF